MTPQDWLALAGVVATLVGTLAGTLLGAALSTRREQAGRAAAAAEQRRLELDEALVASDLSLAELDPSHLAVAVLQDRSHGLDRSAETLHRLQDGAAAAQARELLAFVRVRHPDARVREVAERLSRDLAWLQLTVTGWYVARVVQGGAEVAGDDLRDTQGDAAAALAVARRHRDELAALARPM